jgi:hypothetical protein
MHSLFGGFSDIAPLVLDREPSVTQRWRVVKIYADRYKGRICGDVFVTPADRAATRLNLLALDRNSPSMLHGEKE